MPTSLRCACRSACERAPLRFIQQGKSQSLVWTTSLDRLGLCPQRGFGTAYHIDAMTTVDEERKLSHLSAAARDIAQRI